VQTQLPTSLLSTEQGREADAILRSCVHCGFCNATCPTYQVLGDELDGPRGRIYLIKQLLEGQGEAETAQRHLDRCLTCRNCETTCPSGVEYSRLLDIGRETVEQQITRPLPQRVLRWGLRQVLPYPKRFALGVGVARWVLPLLPKVLRKAIPPRPGPVTPWPLAQHSRRVILLGGCVQSVAAPEINRAAARVMDSLGISVLHLSGESCCGAVHQHMAAPDAAQQMMRRNIDAWWPHLGLDGDTAGSSDVKTDVKTEANTGDDKKIEVKAEAIVSTASACGLQVKEYGHYLQHDVEYAQKAAQISALVKDISEIVAAEPVQQKHRLSLRIAFHAPCTLQHGQRLSGVVEGILRDWGGELVPVKEGHLCCGSAGTYSIMQPELSRQVQKNKLAALQEHAPQAIASANIGCLLHLREGIESSHNTSGSSPVLPVKHWVEVLADCLPVE